jgi:hypothetical protein
MIKKIVCLIKGHNIETKSCPFTKATYSICLRCSPKVHSTKMSFN